jgi:NAD-dependent dihydropyrimidine dehydrogenase PreA subunit
LKNNLHFSMCMVEGSPVRACPYFAIFFVPFSLVVCL